MSLKEHCDICDAVIPEDQEFVHLIRKSDYYNKDWRYARLYAVVCYPCMGALLPSIPEAVAPAKEEPCS